MKRSTGKLLIVEDNRINCNLLANILKEEYEVLTAGNGKDAFQVLSEYGREIVAIVLDLKMPVMDGYEFMEKFADVQEYRHIPIIIETASGDAETEEHCLELGAWDFITKPIQPTIVRIRVRHAVERAKMATMEIDSLTGLYRKDKFYRATKQMLERNKEKQFAFLCFDIDRFKMINTFYGNAEGDRFLKYVAKVLKNLAAENIKCTFGHIQADQFCVCMEYDEYQMNETVEFINKEVSEFNKSFYIKPSIGIYIISNNSEDVSTMYDKAELAAKTCKNNSLRLFSYYTENLSEQLLKEQDIINEMNEALEQGQFHIYLQPKYDIHTEKPAGAEALVRWIHPVKGIISPGEFIPIFERNGFIGKLDFFMWEGVCKLLRQWMDEGLTPLPVSVNISRVNIYNPHLTELFVQLISFYEIPPELLNLEITESAFVDNQDLMIETVDNLREAGFQIFMDDFGSGYSSLNILKDLKVDVLKVDMKFMPQVRSNGKSEKILTSVVRMAKWIQLPVIAEGVETLEQKEFLRSIGCDYIQGYYYARPMPVEEYEKLIAESEKPEPAPVKASIQEPKILEDIWKADSSVTLLFEQLSMPVALYECDEKEISLMRVNVKYSDSMPGHDLAAKELYRDTIREVIRNHEGMSVEYPKEKEDGQVQWFRVWLQEIAGTEEKHLVMAAFVEITSEMNLKAELEKYQRKYISAEKPGILIVDDLRLQREIMAGMFKGDYEIYGAENGKVALDILEKHGDEIEIILLDLEMPVMDGREFLVEKNKRQEIMDIPVIVISSEDSEEMQCHMLELGVNDYVTKPFITEMVKRRIKNVMEFHSRFQMMKEEYQNHS